MFILVIVSSFVFADSLCKESDNEKEYDKKGYVKYGVTQYDDVCVLKPDADLRLPESQYLKEYYCDSDTRMHKIIDCAHEGYEKCKDGACVSSTSSVNGTKAPVVVLPSCGDDRVTGTEECDPPDKICYEGEDIGLCSKDCKCVIKIVGGHVVSENTTVKPEIVVQDVVKNESKPVQTVVKEVKKTVVDEVKDIDGVPSTQTERLSLPKEPKKGLFSRLWNWLFG